MTWDRLLIGCFTHVSLKTWFSNQAMFFFCFGVTQTWNCKCAKPFCFLFLVFWLSFVAALAGFASRSDLFRDKARLTKHRRKVNQRHLILQAMYTTMWLDIDCWLAVSHVSLKTWFSNPAMFFFCFGVTQTRNRKCAKPFCFLILVSCFLTLVCGGPYMFDCILRLN